MSCGVVGDFLGGMDSPPTSRGQAFLGNDDIKSGDDGGGGRVVRLWGLGLHFGLSVGFWVGDGRSGTLTQDLFGTYADACGIGGCPAIPYTHALGDLPVSRASLRGAFCSPHQRSTAMRSSIRLEAVTGELCPPMAAIMEPRRGSRALIPVTPGRTLSRASQCQRHRRPKIGSTDSAGPLEGGVPLRADGPSIAWMDGEGARDP